MKPRYSANIFKDDSMASVTKLSSRAHKYSLLMHRNKI